MNPRDEFVRIEVVFGAFCAKPAHGGFAIMNLGREGGLLAQPVTDLRDGVTFLEKR